MNKILLLATLVVAMLTLAAAPALAANGYRPVGAFNEAAPDGLPAHVHRIAVNHTSGDVYVTDPVNDQIAVSKPNGTGVDAVTTFGFGVLTDPYGIAIDQSTGDVYVSDQSKVVKFVSDNAPIPTFTRDATFAEPVVTGPLSVDQTSHELLVADTATNHIRRYGADGAVVSDFDGSAGSGSPGAFVSLQDLAVDSTGDVVVVDAIANPALGDDSFSRVERFAANGEWKATIGPVAQAATVAIVPADDNVIVSGDQNRVYSDGTPSLHVFTAGGTPVGSPTVDAAALQYSTVAGIAVAGGPAGQLFVAADNGDYGNAGDEYAYGNTSVQIYAPLLPEAPTIVGTTVEPAYAHADLRARINPGNQATQYHFEYGLTEAYGSSTSEKTIPSGSVPVNVTGSIGEGLAPGTTYHLRAVARNTVATTNGPDQVFTTLALPGDDGCSNAAVRKTQHSDFLGDCRAWEMVSPVDKNGGVAGPTNLNASPVVSTPSGDAVGYFSDSAFAGIQSSGLGNAYVGTRGPSGWSTQGILPPTLQDGTVLSQAAVSNFLSPDLSKALVWTIAPLTDNAPVGVRNLYVRDNVTGRYRLVTLYPPSNPARTVFPTAVGVSTDYTHVLVQSRLALTPDAPITATSNLYEWVAGTPDTFRLVSVLPDGSISPDGAGSVSASIDHAMSADGSRIFFTAPAYSSNLYVRENGQSTTQISANGLFWTATPSGSQVLFTDGDGLERYDVANATTTLLSPDHEPADGSNPQVSGVVGASDDLSRVYFVATGQLVQGEGEPGVNNLYVFEDGAVKFIATLAQQDNLAANEGYPANGQRAVTADGRHLAFASRAQLTDYDNVTPRAACPGPFGDPGPCRELYVYDDATGIVSCPSCAGGAGDSVLADVGATNTTATLQRTQENFAADGSRLFFQSTKPLAPQDHNGVSDVYLWEHGKAQLISSGAGSRGGSLLVAASASGDDVFFTTDNRLAAQDQDGSSDVYDARVGGGFDGPAEVDPPCSGESCHGPATAPVALPPAGSVTFSGSGNARPASPAARTTTVTVAKSKTIVGSVASLRITVPGKGRLSVSGSGLKASTKTIAKAGTSTLKITLSARARAVLKRHKSFKAKVRLVFKPNVGKAQSVTVALTFNSASQKKGR